MQTDESYMVDILHPFSSLKYTQCRGPPEDINFDTQQSIYLKDKVYVGGGCYYFLIGKRAAARLCIYTPATDTWNTLDTPVYNFALTTYRSKLVLVGGRKYVGENIIGSLSNKLWTLSEDGHWEETLPPMEMGCSAGCAASHENLLLVIDNIRNVIHLYNGRYWAKAQHLPEELTMLRATAFNGYMYVIGRTFQEMKVINRGFYMSLDSLVASCEQSDTSTVWERLPDIPGHHCYPSKFGGRLIAVGPDTIFVFFPFTLSWVNVECPSSESSSVPLCVVSLPSNELIIITGNIVFKVTVNMTPFDPDSKFTVRALLLVEAAGIPLMRSLKKHTGCIEATLGINQMMINSVTPKKLFKFWLEGDVELPPTWRNLLLIVRESELDDLGYQIETYLRTGREEYYPADLGEENPVMAVKENEDNQLLSLHGLIFDLKQEVASLREENNSTIFENKELKSENELLRSHLSIKEEVEEKPPTLVSVKTENIVSMTKVEPTSPPFTVKTQIKGETATVNKEKTTLTQSSAAWGLHGVEVCGEMTVVVYSSGAQQIMWEGFGLKLHIEEGSLPVGIDQCTLTIKASLSGQYEFPDNSYLVSAIFWLRCEPMCKFTKPVTVEMEHCARSENVANHKMKFVRAVCSQKQLPYTFKELGGNFASRSSYGVIKVNGFSGLGITQEQSEEREYCSQIFYIGHPKSYRIHFVVTWNIVAHLNAVKVEYKKAIHGIQQPVNFESDSVTLDIPVKGISMKGWTITPLMHPVVTKKQVDNYKEGKMTPCCQLVAEVSRRRKTVPVLKHQVQLKGAKYPHNMFVISLPAGDSNAHVMSETFGDIAAAEMTPPPNKRSRSEGVERANLIPQLTTSISDPSMVSSLQNTQLSPQNASNPVATRLTSNHLSFLLGQLSKHAASWRDIGMNLGFTEDELRNIQANVLLLVDSPKSWLRTMLSDWLQWAPGDGRGSTDFATLEKLKAALSQAGFVETANNINLRTT